MTTTPQTCRGAAASLKGRAHAENQDAWAMVRSSSRGAIYAIADGVSTSRRGRWAARHACTRVGGLLRERRELEVEDLLQVVSEVDWELREEGRGSAACTLSVAWLRDGRACVLHVGDSAVYRLRGGEVARLSQDMGRGARLVSYLGMGAAVSDRLQVLCEPLQEGDGLLLVTDGVNKVIRPGELAAWWRRIDGDPAPCVKGVVAEVWRRQGQDDATVIAVKVG
ncbi:protein phosphatase 2C domain-containing protein [Myxococcota bacterium]|nr:protein phosphatase 2C domain-containing protein [Myxococcota bacterium]